VQHKEKLENQVLIRKSIEEMAFFQRLPPKGKLEFATGFIYIEQSIDEAYGLPENFLEVEVSNALTHGDPKTGSAFTDYAILLNVRTFTAKNFINYIDQYSSIQIEIVKSPSTIQRFRMVARCFGEGSAAS
jgi:hypothetical protein